MPACHTHFLFCNRQYFSSSCNEEGGLFILFSKVNHVYVRPEARDVSEAFYAESKIIPEPNCQISENTTEETT